MLRDDMAAAEADGIGVAAAIWSASGEEAGAEEAAELEAEDGIVVAKASCGCGRMAKSNTMPENAPGAADESAPPIAAAAVPAEPRLSPSNRCEECEAGDETQTRFMNRCNGDSDGLVTGCCCCDWSSSDASDPSMRAWCSLLEAVLDAALWTNDDAVEGK
jgi:hypothetical protein